MHVREPDEALHGDARMSAMMRAFGPDRFERDRAIAGFLQPHLDLLFVFDARSMERFDHRGRGGVGGRHRSVGVDECRTISSSRVRISALAISIGQSLRRPLPIRLL